MKNRLFVTCLLLAGLCACEPPGPVKWTYKGEFHEQISNADKISVRAGGIDRCLDVDPANILFETTDAEEIAEVHKHLKFEPNQVCDGCKCMDYPGIDWYKGKERIAITGLTHSRAVRWEGFRGDGRLTKESAKWFVEWLAKHGVRFAVTKCDYEKPQT